MFGAVIIGIDGREGGRDAVTLVERLADRGAADIVERERAGTRTLADAVSGRVLRRAACPVVVVPRGGTTRTSRNAPRA